MKQAKLNIKDDPRYLAAEEILFTHIDQEQESIIPTSMRISRMYRTKVFTTAIFTILGVFGFTNAILTFDWVQMLSYTFTIIIGIVFGWISMNEAEIIWTDEHLRYAKYVEEEKKRKDTLSTVVPQSQEMAETQHIL